MKIQGLKKHKTWAGFVLASLALMMLFQNCGGVALDLSAHQSDSGFDENAPVQTPTEDPQILADFFKYPYATAPEFYFESQVKRVAEADNAGVGDIVTMASVALATGQSKTIEYTLKVQDSKKITLCPDETGTLSGGRTTVVGRCTTARWKDAATVILNIRVDGRNHTFERKE